MSRKKIDPPVYRKLRGYAFDPSLSTALETTDVNELTYHVPWEELLHMGRGKKRQSFPVGEYLEIVDYDPASKLFYDPVDLDDGNLLAQDGHPPSVGNPQFHQQMVYAVIMTTITNFEKALGRKVQWAEECRFLKEDEDAGSDSEKKKRKLVNFGFVQRLRVYPHALRQANAYYDPQKKALLFGYFNSTPADPKLSLPGSTVFTCLSHDIIAHETAHAILDGFHRRYIDPSHPDTRAFHEAFSDIVALFQHFSFPEVLKHQIAKTRGNLRSENLLGRLAQQFGQASGGYGGLRDAIGKHDPKTGKWEPHVPNPEDYNTKFKVHDRGAILVAAIFDAFTSIYHSRAERVIRIATRGSGILSGGALLPDLVDSLAEIAANSAKTVLRICVRALDYCPPMDITFGDYLRAILTADYDLVEDDTHNYRVAFVEAFRKRGISAEGIRSMAVEELVYPKFPDSLTKEQENKLGVSLRKLKNEVGYLTNREDIFVKTKKFIGGAKGFHKQLEEEFVGGPEERKVLSELTGLLFPDEKVSEALGMEFAYLSTNTASYAVSDVRLASRPKPDGGIVNHVIVTLAQKRGVSFKEVNGEWYVDEQEFFVPDKVEREKRPRNHIILRGGCTLIFDLDEMKLRYAIKKDIDDRQRMLRQFKFQFGITTDSGDTLFDSVTLEGMAGPFACMHASHSNHSDSHAG